MSTQTKSNKNQISIIIGELANTFYHFNKDYKDMPVILIDTHSLEYGQRIANNFTPIVISNEGTGANPAKGRELATNNLDQVLELIANKDVINIFLTAGGGTQGVGHELADKLKELGYLVIIHPVPLLSMDGHGDRTENLLYCTDAIKDHNHFWIQPEGSEDNLKELAQLVSDRLNLMLEITNFRNFDNSDYFKLWQGREFTICTGSQLETVKTSLARFTNDKLSSFFVGESNENGSFNNAIKLQMMLKPKLVDNGISKFSPKLGDTDELLVIACR